MRADHRGQRGVQAGDDDQAVDVAEQRAVGEQRRGSGCRRCRRPARPRCRSPGRRTRPRRRPGCRRRRRRARGRGPPARAPGRRRRPSRRRPWSCTRRARWPARRASPRVARSTSAGRSGCSRRASRTRARTCSVLRPVPQMTSGSTARRGQRGRERLGRVEHRAQQRLGGAAGAERRVGGDQERSETAGLVGVGAVVQRGRLHVLDSNGLVRPPPGRPRRTAADRTGRPAGWRRAPASGSRRTAAPPGRGRCAWRRRGRRRRRRTACAGRRRGRPRRCRR